MNARLEITHVIELNAEEVCERLRQFHLNMMQSACGVDELQWQLREFQWNEEDWNAGMFKAIFNRGYAIAALGSRAEKEVRSFFRQKEFYKNPEYAERSMEVRIMQQSTVMDVIMQEDLDFRF